MKVDLSLPSDVSVIQSVNQGVPVLLEYPRSPFSGQVGQLADLVLTRADEPGPGMTAARR
jgi:MinD-like ATPase involved in chromosome partitioning or flagellar assembly